MRSALVALTCTLLAACTVVAQEAPRSPGPTNPNPPQQTPLDETKSGSRALTGSDDIPALPTTPDATVGEHVKPDLKPMPPAKVK
jgi:hypothetical protein